MNIKQLGWDPLVTSTVWFAHSQADRAQEVQDEVATRLVVCREAYPCAQSTLLNCVVFKCNPAHCHQSDFSLFPTQHLQHWVIYSSRRVRNVFPIPRAPIVESLHEVALDAYVFLE